MELSLKDVDAKKSLRIVWIVEGALLFTMSFIVLLIWPDRVAALIELAPYLFGLIALQATGAIGGSSLKRWTESLKLKAQNGGNHYAISDPGLAIGNTNRNLGSTGADESIGPRQGSGSRRSRPRAANAEDAGGLP